MGIKYKKLHNQETYAWKRDERGVEGGPKPENDGSDGEQRTVDKAPEL